MCRPRYLGDEDLRGSVVKAVRRAEPAIEITTIVEQGMAGTSDEEVLEFAWQQQWIVVSHDVNTMKAEAEKRIDNGDGVHGLFLVPQSRTTRSVAESLVLIWAASEFEEWKDRIVLLPV